MGRVGAPQVPGNLDVWKQILRQKSDSKVIRDWEKRDRSLDRPEQLLEAMVAFSRVVTDVGPTANLPHHVRTRQRATRRQTPLPRNRQLAGQQIRRVQQLVSRLL